jgi:predicted nucleic acid-binding protein
VIIVDTGVLLAAADADDRGHVRCSQLLRGHRGHLAVAAPVIIETSWQIERNLGPSSEAGFLRLGTTGEVEVIDLGLDDYRRCVELIETYADMGLGLVDASVVTVAERLELTAIATPQPAGGLQRGPSPTRRRFRADLLNLPVHGR